MKPRPRSVEREVAAHLTDLSLPLGYQPIERIPVLGRTGPDLTTNELGLVVDVKSRLSCPKTFFWSWPFRPRHMRTQNGAFDYVCVQLDKINELLSLQEIPLGRHYSTQVDKWFDHMDEWRRKFMPHGITALVLHRPKMPIGHSILVIHEKDLEALRCKLQKS